MYVKTLQFFSKNNYLFFFKQLYLLKPQRFFPPHRSDEAGTRLLLKRDIRSQDRLLKFLPSCLTNMDRWNPRAARQRERHQLNLQFARRRFLTGVTFLLFSFFFPFFSLSFAVASCLTRSWKRYRKLWMRFTSRVRNLLNGPRRHSRDFFKGRASLVWVYLFPSEIQRQLCMRILSRAVSSPQPLNIKANSISQVMRDFHRRIPRVSGANYDRRRRRSRRRRRRCRRRRPSRVSGYLCRY